MKPNPKMTASHVLARVALLVAAWGVVWAVTPQALLSSPGASFAWWTAMKGLVWFALATVLLRPDGRRAWLGEYRGRIGTVVLLALAWVLLDTAAVRMGLKPPVVAPSAANWLAGWNATLNVLFIAPLFEELLFRGLIWSKLEAASLRRVHVWLLSAAAFGCPAESRRGASLCSWCRSSRWSSSRGCSAAPGDGSRVACGLPSSFTSSTIWRASASSIADQLG